MQTYIDMHTLSDNSKINDIDLDIFQLPSSNAAISRSLIPDINMENRHPQRGQSTGPRRPFRGHGQRGQHRSRSQQGQHREHGQQGQHREHGQQSQHEEHGQRGERGKYRRGRQGQHGQRGQHIQSNQRGQHSAQASRNVQESCEPSEYYDWFDLRLKVAEPDENSQQSDSRSSSPSVSQFSGPKFHRQSRNSSGSAQYSHQEKCSKYLHFLQLKRLSKMDENEVAAELSHNPDFKLLLNSDLNKDFIVVTLCILAKLGQANFTRIVINILSDVCQSKFLANLEHYLVSLPSETQSKTKDNRFYWENIDGFWNTLYAFYKAVINFVPVDSHGTLIPVMKLTMRYVIESIKTKADHKIDKEIEYGIQKLHQQLKKKREKGSETFMDFRTLNIVPTVEDLNDHHPYIRPCKTHGAYDSVDHYLDVQFRLVREDFLCPLREGIREYKEALAANRKILKPKSDIRVFQNVKLIGSTIVRNQVGITISFGVMPKINWNRSKLFMYGSLLCFTNDNFKSIFFATVAERDPKLLGRGELVIELCTGSEMMRNMYNCSFVMVESKVYFLPYYHTLRSLRFMTEENFPMKRYIVDAESSPSPPKYLDQSTVYVCKGFRIPVMDTKRWPSAKYFQFDQSQYEAFKCALLQELSVLHGPPGTGKTFMALQIASTLLANSSSWYKSSQPTPMIVVCLTNHALDQFLEGIMLHTESLVRIGEQSKNPNLTKYKLKNVRDNYFNKEKKKNSLWRHMYHNRNLLNVILNELSMLYSVLRALTSDTVIVSPHILRQYANDDRLHGINADDLITQLFGANSIPLIQEINTYKYNSGESSAKSEYDSEDENIDIDDDFDVASVVLADKSQITCFDISDLDAAIHRLETKIIQCSTNKTEEVHLKEDFNKVLEQFKTLQTTAQGILSQHPLSENQSTSQNYLKYETWEIYSSWLLSCHEVVQKRVVQLETEYDEISAKLDDFKQMTDLEVMRNALVIGLTTTGAARLHETLRALKAPIVLVEEAAEILEAHVICSLTEHCQQVILIGDHKQLRPKPATYELEVNYNLNISLFERIVKMRNKSAQLVVQHRMRPQIAELISPAIYETLVNHVSVFTYPAVKGLEKNLFFLHHQNHELGTSESESMSNPFEIKFLLAFAQYLLQQGYTSDEITILCTYSGQLLKFKEAKRSMPMLCNVRVTTVDNYQGEENKIILLSLVRNNHNGNIGFLRTENRVCVALSRAREGLYIMGNMDNLIVNNEIWPKIKKTLENNDAIGSSLVLQCQNHPDQLTEIRKANDFKISPTGGCSRQCDTVLPCGHTCINLCHISDRDHENYVCKEPCLKRCPNGHRCDSGCNVACPPCKFSITTNIKCGHIATFPCCTDLEEYKCQFKELTPLSCGHTVRKPCHLPFATFQCTHICAKLLSCGHTCKRKCHIKEDPDHLQYVCFEECKKIALECALDHRCYKRCHESCGVCIVDVIKERSCGHKYKVQCSNDVEKKKCSRRCKRELPCGHTCKEKCFMPCGNCKEMTVKIVPDCGHEIKIPCSENPTVAACTGQCPRKLECGHPCKAQCKEPCTKRCEYPRPLPKLGLCQHIYSVPCYKIEAGLPEYADKLLQHCPQPCATALPCGHVCNGSCGSCKQGRIHIACHQPCNKILICGHKCTALCKDQCRPCNKICSLKCQHTECKLKCRVPCTPCQEPCSWRCEHLQCEKLCFEICDREACNEPCRKLTKCGHPCIGFCGEPCPPLCRVCDEKDLPTLVSNKSKSDARFVYLPDCGHCIESDYLDWEWHHSFKIGIKACPVCKSRITHCVRYTNQLKKECKNIEFVVGQVSFRLKKLRDDQQRLVNDINEISQVYTKQFQDFHAHKKLFENLKTIGNGQKHLSISCLKDIRMKLIVTVMILRKLYEIPNIVRDTNNWPVVLNQIIILITCLPTDHNMSYQMVKDIENELIRLHYMVQLCKLEKFHELNKDETALQTEIIYLGLLNLRKFTDVNSNTIYKQLMGLKDSLQSSLTINEEKNIMIKTVGLDDEDWYKCPMGHVFLVRCEKCLHSIPSSPVESE
ncbi:NFX1-type zinc finger-containing protein 1-like isoform X1 [Neodiprion pinetum]|uniref:NFX1-type zinc finger-containing protein 1-like isoform X1 n=1 Tax=Neodiprion pinetum TaxID=441929 RepID=UPI001EDF4DE3|nr:NFX1-type zinc finger-containing protein 1-like isoform X1 [Neodiprion pinetum]